MICNHGDFYTCNDRYNPGHLVKHKWENCFTVRLGIHFHTLQIHLGIDRSNFVGLPKNSEHRRLHVHRRTAGRSSDHRQVVTCDRYGVMTLSIFQLWWECVDQCRSNRLRQDHSCVRRASSSDGFLAQSQRRSHLQECPMEVSERHSQFQCLVRRLSLRRITDDLVSVCSGTQPRKMVNRCMHPCLSGPRTALRSLWVLL